MEKKKFFVFDYVILLSTLFLIVVGVVAIYSSNYDISGEYTSKVYLKQIVFGVVGLLLMLGMVFMNYTMLAEHRSIIYVLSIMVLIAVLIPGIGRRVHGARSWLFFFQPSEIAKLSTIIVLAGYLDSIGADVKKFKGFAIALLIAGLPMGLILIQPDFGTFLVYVPITLAMLFVAGARLRYLIGLVVIGTLGLSIPMFLEYSKMIQSMDNVLYMFFSNKAYIFYLAWVFLFICVVFFIVNLYMKNRILSLISYVFLILFLSMLAAIVLDLTLKEYQRHRLLVFLNPQIYRRSSGYNIIQALIAIGSGGLTGKGFLQGSQSQLDFIPQQVNDFIFSNIGEEWGFFGSLMVLLAFFIILYKGSMVAYQAKDKLGTLMVTGVITMFFFHVLVNVGMVLGMMPITGIPLPFISAGGSSLLTSCGGIGLIFSVEVRRFVHREDI